MDDTNSLDELFEDFEVIELNDHPVKKKIKKEIEPTKAIVNVISKVIKMDLEVKNSEAKP